MNAGTFSDGDRVEAQRMLATVEEASLENERLQELILSLVSYHDVLLAPETSVEPQSQAEHQSLLAEQRTSLEAQLKHFRCKAGLAVPAGAPTRPEPPLTASKFVWPRAEEERGPDAGAGLASGEGAISDEVERLERQVQAERLALEAQRKQRQELQQALAAAREAPARPSGRRPRLPVAPPKDDPEDGPGLVLSPGGLWNIASTAALRVRARHASLAEEGEQRLQEVFDRLDAEVGHQLDSGSSDDVQEEPFVEVAGSTQSSLSDIGEPPPLARLQEFL